MRYHYEKHTIRKSIYGETYECDHPVYSRCALFKMDTKGLAIIQQRYDPVDKSTKWSEIDPWLTGELYLHPKFESYFDDRSAESDTGLYPTVTIRQIMGGLKMKPLSRERWETCFVRREI